MLRSASAVTIEIDGDVTLLLVLRKLTLRGHFASLFGNLLRKHKSIWKDSSRIEKEANPWDDLVLQSQISRCTTREMQKHSRS